MSNNTIFPSRKTPSPNTGMPITRTASVPINPKLAAIVTLDIPESKSLTARKIARTTKITSTATRDTQTGKRQNHAKSETVAKTLVPVVKMRTTIAIAHRLSTLRNADRVVVMESGRILEEGTHEELIHKGGTYAELCRIQASFASEVLNV